MKLLNHRHVVRLHEVLSSSTKLYIVMDFIAGGELFRRLEELGGQNESMARKYFQQLIDGVDYCHKQGVFHRDLKPENLLLDENGVLKITDFGFSSIKPHSTNATLYTQCGTPEFAAPEIIAPEIILGKDAGYHGGKADCWSCGIVLYGMLVGSLPFESERVDDLFDMILQCTVNYPKQLSPMAKDLISKILVRDPRARLSIAQVKMHPWFQVDYNGDDKNRLHPFYRRRPVNVSRHHSMSSSDERMRQPYKSITGNQDSRVFSEFTASFDPEPKSLPLSRALCDSSDSSEPKSLPGDFFWSPPSVEGARPPARLYEAQTRRAVPEAAKGLTLCIPRLGSESSSNSTDEVIVDVEHEVIRCETPPRSRSNASGSTNHLGSGFLSGRLSQISLRKTTARSFLPDFQQYFSAELDLPIHLRIDYHMDGIGLRGDANAIFEPDFNLPCRATFSSARAGSDLNPVLGLYSVLVGQYGLTMSEREFCSRISHLDGCSSGIFPDIRANTRHQGQGVVDSSALVRSRAGDLEQRMDDAGQDMSRVSPMDGSKRPVRRETGSLVRTSNDPSTRMPEYINDLERRKAASGLSGGLGIRIAALAKDAGTSVVSRPWVAPSSIGISAPTESAASIEQERYTFVGSGRSKSDLQPYAYPSTPSGSQDPPVDSVVTPEQRRDETIADDGAPSGSEGRKNAVDSAASPSASPSQLRRGVTMEGNQRSGRVSFSIVGKPLQSAVERTFSFVMSRSPRSKEEDFRFMSSLSAGVTLHILGRILDLMCGELAVKYERMKLTCQLDIAEGRSLSVSCQVETVRPGETSVVVRRRRLGGERNRVSPPEFQTLCTTLEQQFRLELQKRLDRSHSFHASRVLTVEKTSRAYATTLPTLR